MEEAREGEGRQHAERRSPEGGQPRGLRGRDQPIVQVHEGEEDRRRGRQKDCPQGVPDEGLAAEVLGDEARGLGRGEDGEHAQKDHELEQEAQEVRADDAAFAGARPHGAHAALDGDREEAGGVQKAHDADGRGESPKGAAEKYLRRPRRPPTR